MVLNFIGVALLLSGALITYKVLMLISNTESPIMVVLTGSMRPGIHRGDLVVLSNRQNKKILNTGDIVVYNLPNQKTPIIHRIIKAHEGLGLEVDVMTKGDFNIPDDRAIYGAGRKWFQKQFVLGRAIAFLPYAGMPTTLLNEHPWFKYVMLLTLFAITFVAGE